MRLDDQVALDLMGKLFAIPALAVWPLISALPIVSMIASPEISLPNIVALALLASGFWGVAGLFLLHRYMLSSASRGRLALIAPLKGRMAQLGFYAWVWIGAYGLFSYYMAA